MVAANRFETDAQGESIVKDASFDVDNAGPNLNGDAVDGEMQVNHLIAE